MKTKLSIKIKNKEKWRFCGWYVVFFIKFGAGIKYLFVLSLKW